MAKGLRKLFKTATKLTENAIIANRIKGAQQGLRLNVEELEERIAPATLAAGEHIPYDTGGGTVGVLYNAGTVAVDVTITDTGGASSLDTFVIDLNNAGAVSLIATDALSATGGAGNSLFTDSAIATLTLQTGIAVADIGALWATGAGALDNGAAPGANSTVVATDGDVTGDFVLDGATSAITAITVTDGGNGTGAFNGGVTTGGDFGTFTTAGAVTDSATGGWTIGDQLTGAWNVLSTSGDIDVTAANGTTASADITITTGGIAGDIIATTGGIAGDITATAGGIAGDITATAGGISGNILATAGAISGDILATAGGISGNITSTLNGISGAITATAGGLSGNVLATAGGISGLITVTADGLSGDVTATAGGISGGITVTAGGLSGNVTATAGGITTAPIQIVAGGLSGDILATAGGIGAAADITITAGGITATGSIITEAGDIDADIVVTDGGVLSGALITAAANFDGVFTVSDDGMAGTLTATTGNITGNFTINDGLSGSVTATVGDITSTNFDITDTTAGTLSGTIQAGGAVNTGTALTIANGITASGKILAGTDVDGAVTITAGGIADGGVITAAVNIDGAIVITDGGLAGDISTTAGDITGNVTVSDDGVTATGSIVAGGVGGDITSTITVTDDGMAGAITTGGNMTGVITGDDLSGTITIGGDLDGSITATDATTGNVGALVVTGVIAPTGAITISAAGGAVNVTAGAIKTAGSTLGISATTDVDVTVNGTDYNGASNGAIEADDGAITITADSADAGNLDNGGDVTITTNYIVGDVDGGVDDEAVNILGDDVTITLNTRAVAVDTDANVLDDITADGDVTITSLTGHLTVGTVDADFGMIGAITTTGNFTATSLTASDDGTTNTGTAGGAGTIGNISAGGTATITTILGSDGVGSLTSVGDMILTSVTATTGNVGAIAVGNATTESSLKINTTVTSTAGAVGDISATDDVWSDGTATIVAGQNIVAAGNVFQLTDNDVMYTIESDNATVTDYFAFTLSITDSTDAADVSDTQDHSLDIDITRNVTATTGINVGVKTSALNEASVEVINDQEIDLSDIDFAAASITAGSNDFGTLTVDGDITAGLSLGAASSADAILIQGDLAAAIAIDNLNVLAASSVNSGTTATIALLDTYSTNIAATSDPVATPANGAYVVPVQATGDASIVMGIDADGTSFSVDDAVSVSVTAAADTEATVTYTAGVFTAITGAGGGFGLIGDVEDLDLSTVTGAVSITGDLTGTLTVGSTVTGLTVTGDISGAIDATGSDLTGNLVLGFDGAAYNDISADLTIPSVGGAITLGNITGTSTVTITAPSATTGITGGVIINDVVAGASVVLPTMDGAGNVVINDDMEGTLSVSVATGGDINITVTGDFGSEINVTAGDVDTITLNDLDLDGIVGSATSTINVAGELNMIDLTVPANTTTDYVTLMSTISTGSSDGNGLTIVNSNGAPEPVVYIGDFNLGLADGVNMGFAVDFDGDDDASDADSFDAAEIAFEETGGSVAVMGTAGYNTTDGQTFSFTDVVVLGSGTLTMNSGVSGTIFSGNDTAVDITVDDITTAASAVDGLLGGVVVDDDADVSGLNLTADGAMAASFDGGTPKANTTDGFEINALSLANGLFVEGAAVFGVGAAEGISILSGTMGPITAGGAVGGANAALTVTAGDAGLITASGNVNIDISVDEAYTFGGVVALGTFNGAFNVEGTTEKIATTGNFDDDNNTYDDVNDVNATIFGAENVTNLAVAGLSSDQNVTVTGADTLATWTGTTMTVFNSDAGTEVMIDETDGNIVNTIIVSGTLAGEVDLTEINATLTAFTVQGHWTGTFDVHDTNAFTAVMPNITTVTAWGSVSGASLNGATYTTAVDVDGDALGSSGTVHAVDNQVTQIGTSDNYIMINYDQDDNTAKFTELFGQLTSIFLAGEGDVKIYAFEGDGTETKKQITKAADKAHKGKKNNIFTESGMVSLPNITTTQGKLRINELVVDGNVGNIIGSNKIKDMWVSGNTGSIVATKYIKDSWIGGTTGTVSTIKIDDLTISGTSTVAGQNSISANKIYDTSVLDAGTLTMVGSKAKIYDSMFFNQGAATNFGTNFRYNGWNAAANADPAGNDAIQMNAVKIEDTILPSLS